MKSIKRLKKYRWLIWTIVLVLVIVVSLVTYVWYQGQSETWIISDTLVTHETMAKISLPTAVGKCAVTDISKVGTRLDGVAGSGSAVNYIDGVMQVSYQTVRSVRDWEVGDRVNLCLVSVPKNCPAGDGRGKLYKATNLRTKETWQAYNSEHSCGGA